MTSTPRRTIPWDTFQPGVLSLDPRMKQLLSTPDGKHLDVDKLKQVIAGVVKAFEPVVESIRAAFARIAAAVAPAARQIAERQDMLVRLAIEQDAARRRRTARGRQPGWTARQYRAHRRAENRKARAVRKHERAARCITPPTGLTSCQPQGEATIELRRVLCSPVERFVGFHDDYPGRLVTWAAPPDSPMPLQMQAIQQMRAALPVGVIS